MPKKVATSSFPTFKVAIFVALFGGVMWLLRGALLPSVAYNQNPINPATLSGEYDAVQTTGEFYGKKVASANVVSTPLAAAETGTRVLGTTDKPKRIEVDLSAQRLYAYEGDDLVHYFTISSGKWGRTPTGTFTIWGKFRYTKMSGGSKELGTYYYLPNVPYVMFFSNDEVAPGRGFSIHGTYWHNNFGVPMSHGCINMKTEEAGIIYNWAMPDIGDAKSGRATPENPGTPVIIYGEAPIHE